MLGNEETMSVLLFFYTRGMTCYLQVIWTKTKALTSALCRCGKRDNVYFEERMSLWN